MGKVLKKRLQFLLIIPLLAFVPIIIFLSQQSNKKIAFMDSTAVKSSSVSTGKLSQIKTVFLIVMENHNWADIKDSPSAPYINNTLLPSSSFTTQYFNPPHTHPSEPNYLWLEAGTNFNVTDDNLPSKNHQSSPLHLVTLLDNAILSWKSYQEDITGNTCPLTNNQLYAPKHNPMVFFDDVTNTNDPNSTYCINHVRPYAELKNDLQNNTVANYNFITPNLCNDMHNSDGCQTPDSIKNGDTWLSNAIPQIMDSKAYKEGGAIFVTWDEGESNGTDSDGPIGMIVRSPYAKGNGYTNTIHYTHSSMLKTLQEIFHVFPLLGDAQNATDLSDLFNDTNTKPQFKTIALHTTTSTPTQSIVTPTPTPTITLPLTPTPLPTQMVTFEPISQPTSIQSLMTPLSSPWAIYKNGSQVENSNFSFIYPDTWQVVFERSSQNFGYTSLRFVFYPPGSIANGQIATSSLQVKKVNDQMLIDIYQQQSSIDDFIAKNFAQYKNKLMYEKYSVIGDKVIYKIKPKSTIPQSDPIYANFGEHGIVLTQKHAYDIGFAKDTNTDVVSLIINTIWPQFTFE